MLVTSFALAPAMVVIPGLDWQEPNIVWLSINMPDGSGKHSLHKYLHILIGRIRRERGCRADDPSWLLGNSTFREMEELVSKNDGRLFCLYDELSTFLAQLNLYRGKVLGVSHELATLIQQYNGRPWTHRTGKLLISISETYVLDNWGEKRSRKISGQTYETFLFVFIPCCHYSNINLDRLGTYFSKPTITYSYFKSQSEMFCMTCVLQLKVNSLWMKPVLLWEVSVHPVLLEL